ncbi:phage nucleotide-binding protein [Weissella uvarum]|uniref:AAA family ATPase n=2 Tax=Lactobacillaceae TaxID=33958 RepID=UPI001961F212|nr:AAA family ATPase [Weissella uvarum]MBM7617286.1 phage nucleotide-binding protein [Weissella uvarum]MCM0595211.1 AAA family ATPase [Weissella uvarum]
MPKYFKEGTIPDVGDMYFIYGGKGTGKTSLSKNFPGLKLMFNFDGSTNAIADTDDIRVIAYDQGDAKQIQRQFMYDFNQNVYKKDEQGNVIINPEIGTIVLDNVTALQNWVIDNIENGAKDGRQNWNLTQKWFRDLSFLLRKTQLPILATAHEMSGDVVGLFKPDMNEKTFNAFASTFDVVGHIYKSDGENTIDMDPENGNKGANRLDSRKTIKANELLNINTEETKEEEI